MLEMMLVFVENQLEFERAYFWDYDWVFGSLEKSEYSAALRWSLLKPRQKLSARQ